MLEILQYSFSKLHLFSFPVWQKHSSTQSCPNIPIWRNPDPSWNTSRESSGLQSKSALRCWQSLEHPVIIRELQVWNDELSWPVTDLWKVILWEWGTIINCNFVAIPISRWKCFNISPYWMELLEKFYGLVRRLGNPSNMKPNRNFPTRLPRSWRLAMQLLLFSRGDIISWQEWLSVGKRICPT